MLTSGGLGTMGYGLPAAIGARIGNPDRDVVVISGDGGKLWCKGNPGDRGERHLYGIGDRKE